MSDDREMHWYQIRVMYQAGNGATYASRSYGFSEPKVTSARMAFVRADLGAPPDAMICSVSYLGLMTQQEFEA